MTRRFTLAAAMLAAACFGAVPAAAEYPDRPITWVVPFPPGGISDVISRHIAKELTAKLGQPVIVENKPGAGGVVGAEAVANAKPDGYTFVYGAAAPMGVNVSLFKKLSYDPVTSFEPVHGISMTPLIIATNPAKPYRTFQELIDYAKKNPGVMNFSSPGIGTAHHLAGELLNLTAGIDMKHIPYKGAAPALADTMSGVIDVMIDNLLVIKGQIEAGRLRALAVTSSERLRSLPDVPTTVELGFPNIVISSWSTVALPAKTPPDVVARLTRAFHEVVNDPDMVSYLEEGGAIVMKDVSGEKLRDFYRSEIAKFRVLVEKSGASAN